MQDNTQRGARALLWVKIVVILCVLFGLLGLAIMKMVGADFMSDESAPLAMGALLLMLVVGFVGLLLGISFCVFTVYWMSWIYHAEKNLRTMTSTKFSPWGAVICTAIPYVGHFIDYFILKDLNRQMVKLLDSSADAQKLTDEKTKANYLNGYLILSILSGVMSIAKDSNFVTGSCFVLGIITLILFLKYFTEILSVEKCLFKQHEEMVLRQKVDQVLREREIEKAASQVQEATYEVSGRSGSMDEPPPSPEN